MNDKMSDTVEVQKHIRRLIGSWAPQGRRLGDERLEVLVLLVALGELLLAGN